MRAGNLAPFEVVKAENDAAIFVLHEASAQPNCNQQKILRKGKGRGRKAAKEELVPVELWV